MAGSVLRRAPKRGQRGQVAILFALMAVVVVGMIALALDFGALVTRHRKLQAYSDNAAIAGAYRLSANPTPQERRDARYQAFQYLRDNLGFNVAGTQFSSQPGNCSFSSDIKDCAFPAPNSDMVVSIYSPSESSPGQLQPPDTATVSVRVKEAVATSLISALGVPTAEAGAFSEAQIRQPHNADFAVYLDGCLNVGNTPLMAGGDFYINQCTINMLSQNLAALCIQSTPHKAGNLLFGPLASTPGSNQAANQSLAKCQAIGGDNIMAMGGISTNPTSIPAPVFDPPPNVPTCPVTGCPVAVANHPCRNHTVDASGTIPNNCYDPGAYTTLGASGAPGTTNGPIANNLNPGVYYITADTNSACYQSNATTSCPGVIFGANTMNANYADVAGKCWAPPNNPGAPTTPTPQTLFAPPCPNGFPISPQVPVDPQCSGSSAPALTPPTFRLTAKASGGVLTQNTYYFRVTALNALGESLSTEQSVVVPAVGSGQASIDVSIDTQAGATGGYVVYGPSTIPGQEVNYPGTGGARAYPAPATVSQPSSPLPSSVVSTVTTMSNGSTPYPVFDTSSCTQGFHNINRNQYENNGVTFVLTGKASICLNPSCQTAPGDRNPTVLLSPYCSTLSNSDTPPAVGANPCPYAIDGAKINDGAFVIYGNTQGLVQASGTGTKWAMTGTLYVPRAAIALGTVTGGSSSDPPMFTVTPGQIIARTASIYTANNLMPFVYYDLVGAATPGYVKLVR